LLDECDQGDPTGEAKTAGKIPAGNKAQQTVTDESEDVDFMKWD